MCLMTCLFILISNNFIELSCISGDLTDFTSFSVITLSSEVFGKLNPNDVPGCLLLLSAKFGPSFALPGGLALS